MNNSKKPVTRFAPSPTGYMHVGGARTALYAWAFARKQGGTFILRIEDTDKEREVPGSIEHIIESLRWLGLEWDEGVNIGGPHAPYKQSERLESYKKYAQMLHDAGLAYADPYTAEELESFRKKAEEEKRPFLYRDHRPENPPVWDGTKPLRLKITDITSYGWNDLIRGDLKAGPEALDDFILLKSDGYPTYNFAHIIDDLEMGVTHIFRADEFISSTPKFLALYDALKKVTEIERPLFATLPPIMGPDGKKKLGKRDGAKDLLDYQKDGILPEAMMNFLAFIGWNPGTEQEIFTPKELVDAFDISGIQKAGGALNEEKLLWVNKEHLKRLTDAEFLEKALSFIPSHISTLDTFKERISKVVPVLRERISVFKEITEMTEQGDLEIFFKDPTYSKDLLLCPEKQRKGIEVSSSTLIEYLNELKSILDTKASDISKEEAKELVWPYADSKGRAIVLWLLRTALSGRERSPDPFTLIEILGHAEAVQRLTKAIEKLHENA
ncbi:MAG: glutamate--tRNA ligase [Candidatus Taylorbacteria bacterium]|nr:glutamate--tRNA ligase [Candidatus Taylorbacteria bacterium]